MLSVTVPGNILLLGEYALLHPGGEGVACAVGRYVNIQISSYDRLEIIGIMGEREDRWTAGRSPEENSPFIHHIVTTVFDDLKNDHKSDECIGRIIANSSEFFSQDKKLGLGSSAAVTVGLVFSLLFLLDPTILKEDKKLLFAKIHRLSIEAHRRIQGRSSSGYDLTASLFGGIGVFQMGPPVTWRRLEGYNDWPLALIEGEAPVSTPRSIAKYIQWQKEFPAKDMEFFESSQKIISQFCQSATWDNIVSAIQKYRKLGIWIGNEISVPAETPALKEKLDLLYQFHLPAKAVGAGGELALALGRDEEALKSIEKETGRDFFFVKTRISQKGLSWS
ncbi:hypothetical protein IIB34_00145 [PVC group bacterium]|nr:hypothetical protein [PVC group bacterium]